MTMTDRYLYGYRRSLLQHLEPNLEETRIQRALRNLTPSEVTLHEIFLQPLRWHPSIAAEVDKITVVCNPKYSRNTPDYHLRRNILQMAHQTKEVRTVMTNLRWAGLLNMGHMRILMKKGNPILCAIAMYQILLKKEPQYFTKFVNGLLISRNGTVANAVEYSADILELQQGILGKSFVEADSNLHFSMRRGKFLPESLRAIMYEQGENYIKGLPTKPVDLRHYFESLEEKKKSNTVPSMNTSTSGTLENRACDNNQQTGKSAATSSKNRNRSSGSRFLQVSQLLFR